MPGMQHAGCKIAKTRWGSDRADVYGENMNSRDSGTMPTSALRTGIKLIAIIVLLIIAWFAYRLLLMIFAGVLFGVFLQGAAQLLERHTPLKGGWALAAVLLILCAFIGL